VTCDTLFDDVSSAFKHGVPFSRTVPVTTFCDAYKKWCVVFVF
jgi:hypothetical protein